MLISVAHLTIPRCFTLTAEDADTSKQASGELPAKLTAAGMARRGKGRAMEICTLQGFLVFLFSWVFLLGCAGKEPMPQGKKSTLQISNEK